MDGTTGSGGTCNGTDEELVAAALAGDEAALRRLVERLAPVLHRVVGGVLRSHAFRDAPTRDDIEDGVQDVFLKLFADDGRRLRIWNPELGRSLDSWAGLHAEGHAVGLLRARGRQPVTESMADDPDAPFSAGGPSPERETMAREELLLILDELPGRLSQTSWKIFDLHFLQERSAEEIRRVLDLKPDAVYQRIHRIRRVVRDIWDELQGGARSREDSDE